MCDGDKYDDTGRMACADCPAYVKCFANTPEEDEPFYQEAKARGRG